MSLNFNPLNVLRRTQKIFAGRAEGPPVKPFNVAMGSTTQVRSAYGAGRGVEVFRDPNDLKPWYNPNLRPFETPRRR